MKKEQMLIALSNYERSFLSMSKQEGMWDKRIRTLFERISYALNFFLTKKDEFEDYELYSFLNGVCIPVGNLRNGDVPLEERDRTVEIAEYLLSGHEQGLMMVHGFQTRTTSQNEVIEVDKVQLSASSLKRPEPAKNVGIYEDFKRSAIESYTIQDVSERLSVAVDDLARDYMLNRSRLDTCGWSSEDALYDRICDWSGRAKAHLEQTISAGSTSEYYKKMGFNVANLAYAMSMLLSSTDEFTLKKRSKELENMLGQMDQFYGQIAKTM